MDGYKDSADMIVDCDYGSAMMLYENKNYSLAKVAFQALGDYKDFADMIPECDYSMAMKSYEDGDYYYAITVFEKINGYKDSDSMIKSAQEGIYNEAMALVDSKEFSKARENFEKIPDYENVSEMIALCEKQERYKSADDDLKKDSDFNSACNAVGRENFTEFMEEYGYTEELAKFQ